MLEKLFFSGVIGPEYSEEAELLSSLLSSAQTSHRLLQIGFSTTAVSLNNPEKYPNFVRVNPNDMTEVEAMVQTMLELGWNRVAIIHDNEAYGRNGHAALKQKAEGAGICISFTAEIKSSPTSDEVSDIRDQIMHGNESHPQISGIVLWGSERTAENILRSFERSHFSDTPIAILSEKSSNALLNSDQTFKKAKGSYSMRPPSGEVKEFSTHWREIFTNETAFQEESSSNPWLRAVFENIKSCDGSTQSCPFSPLSENELSLNTQPLSVRYAIMASHLMAKSILSLYVKICGNETALCPEFLNKLEIGDMILETKELVMDMANDFSFRLTEFFNVSRWKINNQGEIEFPSNTSLFDLYNFRYGGESDGVQKLQLIKIGEFVNGEIEIDKEAIRDYDSEEVKYWPNIRKGMCGPGTKCSECIPADISDKVIVEFGDVYVIGLVPIHNAAGTTGCGSMRPYNGYQIAEAIKLAVTSFNNKTERSNFAKIGYVILNSCNSASVVQRKITALHDTGVYLQDGTMLQLSGKILGYIGDVGSGVTIAASDVLTPLKSVLISYSSTSPKLSDRERHPFFMRDVTASTEQVRAMLSLVKSLGAEYVQIIYSQGAYGEDAKNVFVDFAKASEICVAQEIMVEENANFNIYFEELRKFPHARIVAVFLRSHVVHPFFKEFFKIEQLTKGTFVYLGSESWSRNEYVLLDDDRQLTLGSVVIEQEHILNTELEEYIRHIQPTPVNENPWVQDYLELKLDCYFPSSFNKDKPKECERKDEYSFEISEWTTTAYSATEALLNGAKSRMAATCGADAKHLCDDFVDNPAELVEEIKQADNGTLFKENGDGALGLNLYQVTKSQDGPQKLVYEKVGQYSPGIGLTLTDGHVQLGVTSVCPNQLACSMCFKQVITPEPPAKQATERTSNSGTIALGVLFGISLVVIAALTVVIVMYFKRKGQEDPYADPYINPVFVQGKDPDYIQAEEVPASPSGGTLEGMHF